MSLFKYSAHEHDLSYLTERVSERVSHNVSEANVSVFLRRFLKGEVLHFDIQSFLHSLETRMRNFSFKLSSLIAGAWKSNTSSQKLRNAEGHFELHHRIRLDFYSAFYPLIRIFFDLLILVPVLAFSYPCSCSPSSYFPFPCLFFPL